MRGKKSGFSLIEMSIVLIIFGILATILTPPFVSSIKYEKRAENKDALNSLKLALIGYAKAHEELPDYLGTAGFSTKDIWGRPYKYKPAVDGSICAASSNDGFLLKDNATVDNAAFALASTGRLNGDDENAVYDDDEWDFSAGNHDDIYEYVTLSQLRYLICAIDPGGGDGEGDGGGDGEGDGGGSISEYVFSSVGNISTGNAASITGDINAGGDVDVVSSSSTGSILSGGNVTINHAATVDGDIDAAGNVVIVSNADINGDVRAGGSVTLNSGATVDGDVDAGGDVTLVSSSEIMGHLYSSGDVTIDGTVNGDVQASGSVSVTYNGVVTGSIVAGADVSIANTSASPSVAGNVESGGNVTMSWGSSVGGNVSAAGSVTVSDGASVEGSTYENAEVSEPTSPEDPHEYESIDDSILTSFTAGGEDPVFPSNKTLSLSPGIYGTLDVPWDGTVTLSAGTYYFDEINFSAGPGGALKLDLSGDADLTIFVVGDASFNDNLQISTDGTTYDDIDSVDQALAARVYLETHGSFTLKYNNDWFGTVLSEEDLTLEHACHAIGSFVSLRTMTLSSSLDITYVSSNYSEENWE